ncbi:AraC family transcriptional regulator [Qaidamihabitans albus]|uniref:AraC family transcriptional regulator n=1 Tax=Qaidamihabitans albus TaxID=2795733 RepID=UPI0018F145BB|nr:AraC family transcriptional regulator [Qaidamihabitans albus]
MDAFAGLLDGPRARGAFLLRSVLVPPWSIRVRDRAPLTLLSMVRGEASVTTEGDDPVRIRPGDVAVVRGPEPYTVSDQPGSRPTVVIHPGARSTSISGTDLCESLNLGVRTWGDDPDSPTVLLVGTYQLHSEVSRRLLQALPTLLVVREDSWDCPLLPLLGAEITKDLPGQDAVLDRLLDLLLVAVLRTWFDRPGAGAPAWYRAYGDPVVGRALRLVHAEPSAPWTVATLADRTGVSRATLARRFTDLVGEAPMAYLTGWRMTLAADLLREPETTVGAVARKVGYGSAFAFSSAFKRVRGVSPQVYRTGALATAI